MKKFVSVFLVLLLLPVFSFAITYDEDSFLGVWVQNHKSGISSTRITTIVLQENHRALYSVDNYDYTSPGETEHKVCSWSVSGNTLTLSEHGQEFRTLYRINTYQLSVDQAGAYQLFFDHVPNSEAGYEWAANASATEINLSPIGRWTSFFFAQKYPELSMDFAFYSTDYYFLENGAVYLTIAELGSDNSSFTVNSQSGIWLGDHNDMTMRLGDGTFKAHIDDDGTMILRLNENFSFVLYRVPDDRQVYEVNTP